MLRLEVLICWLQGMAKDLVEEDTSDLSDLDFEVAPSFLRIFKMLLS